MGAVKKLGPAPIIEYLEIAAAPTSREPGNYVMYGPGMGAESISSMAAAGCQILTSALAAVIPLTTPSCRPSKSPAIANRMS